MFSFSWSSRAPLYFIASGLTLALAAAVLRRVAAPGSRWFAGLVLAVCAWTLLSGFEAAAVPAALTNDYHRLFWTTITPLPGDQGNHLVYLHGPLFWLALAHNYILMVISAWWIIQAARQSQGTYRRQALALLVGGAIPWCGNALSFGHERQTKNYRKPFEIKHNKSPGGLA